MSKRILIVCQHFWPENFRINDITQGFTERGYEVDVLCGIPNYPKGEWFPGYGFFKKRHEVWNKIRIFRCGEIKRKGNTNLRIFLNYVSFPFFSLFHILPLMLTHYDKIFLYQLSPVMMSIAGLLLGKLKRIETIMYVLDLWPDNLYSVLDIQNKTLRHIAQKVSHWHYKKADKLIGISETMKRKLYEITGNKNIIALPQFCEKIYEKTVEDSVLLKKFKKGFNIVYTGNISPAQNYTMIVAAAKIIVYEKKITDINWIIVGDGMSRTDFENEVEKSALKKYFYFEGSHPVTDIPKYTFIADCLLATLCKSDNLDCTIPAKVISYFAAGKPLLLSMDGDACSLVNETKSGFACSADNLDEFVKNIEQLYYASNRTRNRMGTHAKEVHLKNFERESNLSKLISFIES